MSKTRVGIIGAGNMAREHARAFRDVPGVMLSGIQSRTRSRAEALAAEFGIDNVCDTVEELHARSRADLAVVTVNVLSMKAISVAAFKYPWTVLLEKPAGRDLSEAEEIAAAARRRESVYVALNRRMYSVTQAALEDVTSRQESRYIRVMDQQDPAAAAAAGQPPEVAANLMFANSIHVIDYLRLFGRGAVIGVAPIMRWNPVTPGVVLAKVSFDSGDIGVYEGIWRGPGPWAVMVQTASRRWEMRPLERAQFQDRGERTLHDVEPDAWDQQYKAGFRRQAEEAVAAAEGRPSRLATIEDALGTMRLVAAIFAAGPADVSRVVIEPALHAAEERR